MNTTFPKVTQRSIDELIERNLLEHKRGMTEIMDRFQNTVLSWALNHCEGNITETAKLLQAHRTTVVHWLDKYGLRGKED